MDQHIWQFHYSTDPFRSSKTMQVESIKGISFEQQGEHYMVLCGAESGVVRVYHEETGHVEEVDFLTVVELLAA